MQQKIGVSVIKGLGVWNGGGLGVGWLDPNLRRFLGFPLRHAMSLHAPNTTTTTTVGPWVVPI